MSAADSADRVTSVKTAAYTVPACELLPPRNGVCVRHAGFCGVVNAQFGSDTKPSRDPKFPP